MDFKDHDLDLPRDTPGIAYDEIPLEDPSGRPAPGVHAVRITLDNPDQLNSYTTAMVKGVIAGMRRASNDRGAVAVVFTGSGTRAAELFDALMEWLDVAVAVGNVPPAKFRASWSWVASIVPSKAIGW